MEVLDPHDPRVFRPTCVPDVAEPDGARDVASLLTAAEHWVRQTLAPAVADALRGVDDEVCLVLELRTSEGPVSWSLSSDGRVHAGGSEAFDALVVVAASVFVDVVSGRRPWGAALLGGHLRAVSRLEGAARRRVPPIFPYLGLSYQDAFERWVRVSQRQHRLPGPT